MCKLKVATSLLLLLFIPAAYAMPCDAGYVCNTGLHHYRIELQRCRYTNSLHLVSLSRGTQKIPNASLGPYWDGKSVGDTMLAFEIRLPASRGRYHVLSVEIPPHAMTGIIRERFADSMPAVAHVTAKAGITCAVE